MSQLDVLIIYPVIPSLIITLCVLYFITIVPLINFFKTLKFKKKLNKTNDPLSVINKSKDIVYFDK